MENNLKEKKRLFRIEVMSVLYLYELTQDSVEQCADSLIEDTYPETQSFVQEIVDRDAEYIALIEKVLVDYKINRISYVDRAIIKLCIHEMNCGLAPAIAVNEALEIAKLYSDEGNGKNVKFLNRVLQNIKDELKL